MKQHGHTCTCARIAGGAWIGGGEGRVLTQTEPSCNEPDTFRYPSTLHYLRWQVDGGRVQHRQKPISGERCSLRVPAASTPLRWIRKRPAIVTHTQKKTAVFTSLLRKNFTAACSSRTRLGEAVWWSPVEADSSGRLDSFLLSYLRRHNQSIEFTWIIWEGVHSEWKWTLDGSWNRESQSQSSRGITEG